jgi:hypothetical protein
MFEPRIRIDRALYERLKERARREGYASVEELIRHALEKAAEGAGDAPGDSAAISAQLKGLGYIE